jgi:hypothetical protein
MRIGEGVHGVAELVFQTVLAAPDLGKGFGGRQEIELRVTVGVSPALDPETG